MVVEWSVTVSGQTGAGKADSVQMQHTEGVLMATCGKKAREAKAPILVRSLIAPLALWPPTPGRCSPPIPNPGRLPSVGFGMNHFSLMRTNPEI